MGIIKNLPFGSKEQYLITFQGSVLDPRMIENVWRWETTTRIGHEQTGH